MDASNPMQPTEFTSHLSVTSQAVNAYGKSYPLSIVKSVEVVPMPFAGSWRTVVWIVGYFLGLAGLCAIFFAKPWELPLDWGRIVSLLVAELIVIAIANILWVEHRRRAARWRYMYGVWLHTKYGRALVALVNEPDHASVIAGRINDALAAHQAEEPIEYYREDHMARLVAEALEVDGRAYPFSEINGVSAVNYDYQSMRTTVLWVVGATAFVGLASLSRALVSSGDVLYYSVLVLLGIVLLVIERYTKSRPDYVAPYAKIHGVGLYTNGGYVPATITPDVDYVNSIVLAMNQVIRSAPAQNTKARRATTGTRQAR